MAQGLPVPSGGVDPALSLLVLPRLLRCSLSSEPCFLCITSPSASARLIRHQVWRALASLGCCEVT